MTITRKPSIEPDDGFDQDRDSTPRKSWEEWDKDRQKWIRREWPGLFEALDEIYGEVSDGERLG